MRAMLISFASHHLWLHWQQTALVLARLFTDYEPGIHYSQIQMQSGTTGINAIRIYNPIKQSIEKDPKGLFIRRWVPELKTCPTEYVHTPWECEQSFDYPAPIIEESIGRQHAAKTLYGLRKQSDFKQAAKKIVKKHASRQKPIKKKKAIKPEQTQLSFAFLAEVTDD
jgi:deoxyribodipyrimidine photo-lyase